MTTSMLRREPVLDGIRGIAILLVLVHHFVHYSGFTGGTTLDRYLYEIGYAGWFGVDVFFVLSGFLITGILYDTKSAPRYFRTFYGRRTLRIFPLYYGVLALIFVASPLLLGRPLFEAEAGEQLWYWTYLSNVDVAANGWRQPVHLGHFWSLAVEEQFYLVWPLFVFALGRRSLLQFTAGCFLLALVLRIVVPLWYAPLAVYVLMPMRMDALAAGAFVALLVRGERGWHVVGRWPLRVALASSSVLAGIFLWRRQLESLDVVVRTVGYSAIAVTAAALVATAMTSQEKSALRRLLSSRVLVQLGAYSYGLYVFHHIVVVTLENSRFQVGLFPTAWGSELPGLIAFSMTAMTLSAALAFASWHLWEAPFLSLKRHFRYERPVATSTDAVSSADLPNMSRPPKVSAPPAAAAPFLATDPGHGNAAEALALGDA